MVQNIKLENVTSNFQAQLSDDARNDVTKNLKLFITGDKINYLYELTTDEYDKLFSKNIWEAYKKSTLSIVYTINTKENVITQYLKLDKGKQNQKQSFFTLKDHKKNFIKNSKCILINPAKNGIGTVYTEYFDRNNKNIRD